MEKAKLIEDLVADIFPLEIKIDEPFSYTVARYSLDQDCLLSVFAKTRNEIWVLVPEDSKDVVSLVM